MKLFKLLIISLFLVMASCKQQKQTQSDMKPQKVEVQGHRGERGNLPENSIAAFLGALHKGVDVLELDVVISKDHRVVVSHEPFMSSVYMSFPSGAPVKASDEKNLNLYKMPYDSIKTFDGGSRGNSKFPNQQKIKTYKPLLSEVFKEVETAIKNQKLQRVKYNIEIKSKEEVYGEFQPQPEAFVDLVMQVIIESHMEDHINIQSFDPLVLNTLHKKYPTVKTAYLVSKGSVTNNLKALDFKPDIYSPNFKLITSKSTVDSLKDLGIKLIPWTVNNPLDIKQQISLGVDGIITDYPERVLTQIKP